MSLQVPHEGLDRLYAYWQSHLPPGRAGAPPRSAIDPLDLPAALWPQLFLYQRTAEGRLRCRLCGTAIVEVQGRDITGLYLDQLMKPEAVELRQGVMLRVLAECRPAYYEGPLAIQQREHRWTYRLMLPLAQPDDPPAAPSLLFGGAFYDAAQQEGDWKADLTQLLWGEPCIA